MLSTGLGAEEHACITGLDGCDTAGSSSGRDVEAWSEGDGCRLIGIGVTARLLVARLPVTRVEGQ